MQCFASACLWCAAKVLDINHNRMEQLPAAVTHCTNLLKLNADNNVLTELVPGQHSGTAGAAAALGHSWRKIQRLYLANNELQDAPALGAELARCLPSLRVCDVSSNYGDLSGEDVVVQILPEPEPEPEPEP